MRGAALALLLFSACEAAEPVIDEATEYRDISGDSQAALSAALERIAQSMPVGHRYYADTHWQLSWNFRVESDDDGCHLSSATTALNVRTTLPRWTAPAKAPADLIKRWNAFSAALRTHEDGHRRIAVDAAQAIADRVNKAAPARDCATLKQAIGTLAQSILDDYRAKELDYDTTTDHGRKQGAVFP